MYAGKIVMIFFFFSEIFYINKIISVAFDRVLDCF